VLTKKNGVTTRSVAAANIKIVCEFSPKLTKGLYKAVSESWEAEGVVNLVADENDPYHITLEGFNDIDGVAGVEDIFVQIDKASYAITNNDAFILSNDLEQDWGADYAGYTNYTYKIVSGSYNSCDGSYTITFNISCALGNFGNYDFVFTRSEE
jgi:hypothetical protein